VLSVFMWALRVSVSVSVQLAVSVYRCVCVCSMHVFVRVRLLGIHAQPCYCLDLGVCSCGSHAFVRFLESTPVTFLSTRETLKQADLIKRACVETASWGAGHAFSSATSSVGQKTSEDCSW